MEADRLVSADHVVASRSLPPAIRASIEALLEEYAQMERLKSSWVLQEATLKAKIEAMEREKVIESKARETLAARVGMLECALKQNRCPEPGCDSGTLPVKLTDSSNSETGKAQFMELSVPLRTSYSDKYKTLPSNFLSRNPISTGSKMLWKYLEELGYKPSPPENPNRNEQGNSADVPVAISGTINKPGGLKDSTRRELEESAIATIQEDDVTVEQPSVPADSGYEQLNPVVGQILARIQHVVAPDVAVDQGYSFDWTCFNVSELQWKPKMTLLHHLDAIRSVQFHESLPVLFTGSEDGTAKLWNLDAGRGNRRFQPIHSYRGHMSIVSSVCIQGSTCASGSVDGNIVVWNLADLDNDDMYDAQLSANKYRRATLKAHSNSIWGLHMVEPNTLYSCGADGFVHVWDVAKDAHPSPRHSFRRKDEAGVVVPNQACSSVTTLSCDRNKLLVSYTSGHLEVFDALTGQVIRSLKQIPRIVVAVSHPILPLALCASVDNTILFCDVNAGTYVHRMLAHAQPVTSIAVSGDGSSMMSACHDSSIRFWDLTKRCCCQDLSAHQTHRRKYGEAIHSVAYHPTLEFAASGGADCAIKIYQN